MNRLADEKPRVAIEKRGSGWQIIDFTQFEMKKNVKYLREEDGWTQRSADELADLLTKLDVRVVYA
jgi:hypothetical protein